MRLTISNNSVSNPQTLDLSNYLDVQPDSGLDPHDPAYLENVISTSLLREGGMLALQQAKPKELVWPLKLNSVNFAGLIQLVEQVDMIVGTPGATLSWTDDGASQATVFDLIAGSFDVAYNYRAQQQHWCLGKLHVNTMPFGRTASPRRYATASGVGPLLMISPYASGGAQVIGASTQAGVAGYGGPPQGASSGVFYWGSPSLAGDAPAMLEISYVAPLPNTATSVGPVPFAVVSLLPDQFYTPLVGASDLGGIATSPPSQYKSSTAVASTYSRVNAGVCTFGFAPLRQASYSRTEPTLLWAGQHRLFVIARASGLNGAASAYLTNQNGGLSGMQPAFAAATPPANTDWGLYDLGTFQIRASEPPSSYVYFTGWCGASGGLDITAAVMLPDNATWFLNPKNIVPSQYGLPYPYNTAPYTNTLLFDDVLGDEFVYWGASQSSAPSPLGSVPSAARITQFSRGLIPRPDPRNGLPIIAILGVNPGAAASTGFFGNPGASWANPQNLRTMAQVNVLERARYILP